MHRRARSISSGPAAPPPSPIPTGKGSRSAASPAFADYIDRSIEVPELILPENVHHLWLADIDYKALLLGDYDSVDDLLRCARGIGVFRIVGHGISSEELRSVLVDNQRIFGLQIECCMNYGDQEKLVWSGHGEEIMGEANSVIGKENFHFFSYKMDDAANKLKAITGKLAKIMAQVCINGFRDKIRDTIPLEGSTLSIYRYHRANIISRMPSLDDVTRQESGQYALSLHLLLESGEFCVQPDQVRMSFHTSPGDILVTVGKELEEWSLGEFKSAKGEIFKPYLHTNRPSFSIEQKWSCSNVDNVFSDQYSWRVSVFDQILVLATVLLVIKAFTSIYS